VVHLAVIRLGRRFPSAPLLALEPPVLLADLQEPELALLVVGAVVKMEQPVLAQ
jgi:hypothetical protein